MKKDITKEYDNKRFGHALRGKCIVCGLDTSLNVHKDCGKKVCKKGQVQIPHDFPEKECANVDCLKMFKPVQAIQKLCPECVAMRKKARLRKRY